MACFERREREEDEDKNEAAREIYDDDNAVYAGHYCDDGNSQRTLSQWKGLMRHKQKRFQQMKIYEESREDEPSGQSEPDYLNLDEYTANQHHQ